MTMKRRRTRNDRPSRRAQQAFVVGCTQSMPRVDVQIRLQKRNLPYETCKPQRYITCTHTSCVLIDGAGIVPRSTHKITSEEVDRE